MTKETSEPSRIEAAITVPPVTRTRQQLDLLPTRCNSRRCRSSVLAQNLLHYVPTIQSPCPTCGEQTLKKCAIIHIIVKEKGGPIKGSEMSDDPSAEYQFLCDRSRKGYAELPDHPHQPRSYTLLPQAATCASCLKALGGELVGSVMKMPPPNPEEQFFN